MPLRPVQRYTLIGVLADFLASKPESEADAILRVARATVVTSGSWGELSQDDKLNEIRRKLAGQTDEVLIDLNDFLPANEQVNIPVTLEIPVEQAPNSSSAAEIKRTSDGPIFLVHGHSHAVLHESVRVLERGTGREVIVLHEQANAGRTILEKFEQHAGDASFAVVLLTGDDEGGIRTSANRRLRGRQNVIFELGFFFGKLGRKRVAVLLEEGVEKPSDIDGLVYIDLDRAGAWKQVLARELEAAGIPVDRSRIP